MSGPKPPERIVPARGTILVASPRLLDPNFMHAVVLLCDHGPEGSYGLVLNRPAEMTLSDIESDAPLLQGRGDPLWHGGPVEPGRLQVLHGLGDSIPGCLPVMPGVTLGGDPDVIRAATGKVPGSAAPIRFVIGYAGWGEGQLEEELHEGSWVVCPADARFVFDPDHETLWRRVLRARGGPFAELVHVPPDPSWN